MMLSNFNEQYTAIHTANTTLSCVKKPFIHSDGGMRRLPLDFVPSKNDVICSRGAAVKKHPGNIRFLQVVDSYLQKYSKAGSKLEKSLIVTEIVDIIRESSPEGGFVKLIDGCWWEAGDNQAREKTSQRLRDNLSSKYSSSSKAKKCRRRAAEASLASKVDDIVCRTNGTALADRIQELTAAAAGSPSDYELQTIFNQANCELLARIKAVANSQQSNQNEMLDDSCTSQDSRRSSTSDSSVSIYAEI